MKGAFRFFLIIWVILLVVFNVIGFMVTNQVGEFSEVFWVSYALVTVAYIGQLACGYYAFKQENAAKQMYSIPVVKAAYSGLITTAIVAVLAVALPGVPDWIGGCVCLLVLALEAIGVMKAAVVAHVVAADDAKIKAKTFYMKSLTVSADSLQARAKSETAKVCCKKVYEAARYSDPMSNEALASVEYEISQKFNAFAAAVQADDQAACETLANDVLILIEDRRKKCMLFK